MKHVLKRLQDGVKSGEISLEDSRTRLGPTEVYFDTCDLKLHTKLRNTFDKNLGYNHLFYFIKIRKSLSLQIFIKNILKNLVYTLSHYCTITQS